jgi:hypothetical protein
MAKTPIVIYDCDGVLCDATLFKGQPKWEEQNGETLPHDEYKEKWDEFYSHIPEFSPIQPVIDTAIGLSVRYPIFIITGRPEAFRLPTRIWLGYHGIRCQKLLMRRDEDRRAPHKIKRDILEQEILPNWNPVLAFENNEETIEMYQQHGILTYAPAHKLI